LLLILQMWSSESLEEISDGPTIFLFVPGLTDPSGPGSPHSRGFYITLNDTLESGGLLWTGDQLVEETYT
jgi:hypothetical protein